MVQIYTIDQYQSYDDRYIFNIPCFSKLIDIYINDGQVYVTYNLDSMYNEGISKKLEIIIIKHISNDIDFNGYSYNKGFVFGISNYEYFNSFNTVQTSIESTNNTILVNTINTRYLSFIMLENTIMEERELKINNIIE